jgi:predicted phosphoribosyltransferase
VCPHALEAFLAVGVWYESFAQVSDEEVIRFLAENRAGRDDGSGEPAG